MSKLETPNKSARKRESLLLAILFNIGIPIFLLSKMSGIFGPTKSLLIAILFPLLYAIYDFFTRKQINPLSVIGFFSLLLKGIFAIFKVDGFWFAVQEAAIPSFIGFYALLSLKFGKPLVNYFIYNENIFNTELLEKKMMENQSTALFYKLTQHVTFIFAVAFLLGGVLNYFLAYNIIVSPAGTQAFNQELARMIFLSYMIVLVPKLLITGFGLWWFARNLKKLTGLPIQDIWQTTSS